MTSPGMDTSKWMGAKKLCYTRVPPIQFT